MTEDHDESGLRRGGFVSGLWRRLSTPSARWSVLALVVVGLVIGAGGTIGTQLMVAATGTNTFCGGACHSMQWVAQEYAQSRITPTGLPTLPLLPAATADRSAILRIGLQISFV